jgi:hypothetical protein
VDVGWWEHCGPVSFTATTRYAGARAAGPVSRPRSVCAPDEMSLDWDADREREHDMIRVLSSRRKSMMHRTGLFALALALCLGLIASNSSAGGDHPRPFHGNVTAAWDNIFDGLFAPPANFLGGGPVTHMGNTTQTGTLTLLAPIAPGMFPGFGSVTIVAANGDSVSFDYVGVLDALTGEGTGSFTFTSGTGRFADVSGQGTFDALIDLSFPTAQPMKVTLDGRISY